MKVRGTAVACDESGSDGEQLVPATHPVFALGSVILTHGQADRIMAEARERTGSQAQELKAKSVVRNDKVVRWLMGSESPLLGNACTYLVEKDYFICAKIIDLLVEEVFYGKGIDIVQGGEVRRMAQTLYHRGPEVLGQTWQELLAAFNSLHRRRVRSGEKVNVEQFFHLVGRLPAHTGEERLDEVLTVLKASRKYAEDFQDLLDEPTVSALDPIVPALERTVSRWASLREQPLRVYCDKYSHLERPEAVGVLYRYWRNVQQIRVQQVKLVDSKKDSRVQVADLVAGISREYVQRVLGGDVGALDAVPALRSFIHPDSLWSDSGVWQTLQPTPVIAGPTRSQAMR
ncbi:DUF3800 domain-containing protein [Micromonospora sp. NPDC004551]|uniref:DUF3800 domain-containing protein n=1 Tax=Micromonospora sp. NPDC004551 TaxID=3154284 RepID=UPI0033B9412A